jgi:C4-dicarboxylate-specific signal transduction histidine kinase
VALELKINGQAAPLGPLAALVTGERNAVQGADTRPATLPALTFSPEQRNFALEFSALDFSEPRSNRYQYRLLGYDKDWINADFEHRSASYGNLWPGDYTLQVRGSNRLGQFSQHQLTVAVRVLPAWWQTWWCWSLALLSIIGSVGGLYYWRVTRLRQIIRLRTAAIASAHDTLASTHQQLAAAHGELAAAHQHLKETQTKLVQSEKMASLGGLVTGIAHEINTPLGTTLVALSGVAKVLHGVRAAVADNSLSKSRLDSATSEALEYTDLALRTATRAADLVTTFKTIAVREGQEHLMEINLAHFLEDSVSLIRPRLEQAGHRLELDLPANLQVHMVPDALQEVLNRVYANVLDHAFADGKPGLMRVAAQQQADGTLDIVVSDNGCGIAAADLPKVFDPFFTTRSGVGGHVGLGLHVAFNHVTQRLKGEISVSSNTSNNAGNNAGSNTGTVVTIRLKPFGLPENDAQGG